LNQDLFGWRSPNDFKNKEKGDKSDVEGEARYYNISSENNPLFSKVLTYKMPEKDVSYKLDINSLDKIPALKKI